MPETPPFEEPWQAHAFALVVALADRGVIAWDAWTADFAAELGAREAGGPLDPAGWFEAWITSLERLAGERCGLTPDLLATRKAAWREAWRHTPHGRPVVLKAGA